MPDSAHRRVRICLGIGPQSATHPTRISGHGSAGLTLCSVITGRRIYSEFPSCCHNEKSVSKMLCSFLMTRSLSGAESDQMTVACRLAFRFPQSGQGSPDSHEGMRGRRQKKESAAEKSRTDELRHFSISCHPGRRIRSGYFSALNVLMFPYTFSRCCSMSGTQKTAQAGQERGRGHRALAYLNRLEKIRAGHSRRILPLSRRETPGT